MASDPLHGFVKKRLRAVHGHQRLRTHELVGAHGPQGPLVHPAMLGSGTAPDDETLGPIIDEVVRVSLAGHTPG